MDRWMRFLVSKDHARQAERYMGLVSLYFFLFPLSVSDGVNQASCSEKVILTGIVRGKTNNQPPELCTAQTRLE